MDRLTAEGGPGAPARTVRKALAILDTLADAPEELGLSALSRRLGISKATTYRLALALQSGGLVEQDPATARYRLGLKLLYLATRALDHMELPRAARAALVELRDRTGESTRLGVLDGNEVVYLDGVDSPQPIRFVYRAGSRAPAYASSIGKVLLAYLEPAQREARLASMIFTPLTPRTIVDPNRLRAVLDQARLDGYALSDEEHSEGVVSVAAPIFASNGQAIGGLGVVGPSYRLAEPARAAVVEAVLAAAQRATLALQGGLRTAS